MSYPEPIWFESQESLYKQAKFFYSEYEKTKEKLNVSQRRVKRLQKLVARLKASLND